MFAPVLIVDDVPTNLMLMSKVLQQPDVEIVTAASGTEAVEKAARKRFAVILLDVLMPEMDGFETAERLRAEPHHAHVPILFVTGEMGRTEAEFKGYEAGAVDFLSKPFSAGILRSKVNVFLTLYRQQVMLEQREKRFRDLAEFAEAVLHNVGNVLNSISVSSGQVEESLQRFGAGNLIRAGQLLDAHRDDPGFLTQHERGKLLPDFLIQMGHMLEKERLHGIMEMEGILKNLSLIKDLIDIQQRGSRGGVVCEPVDLKAVIEDAVKIKSGALTNAGVELVQDLAEGLSVRMNRAKLTHVVINLVKNAIEALQDVDGARTLSLKTRESEGTWHLVVRDNGSGMDAKTLNQLFTHGFTTKSDGHGFGLHYCFQTMQEIGGRVRADSSGPGQGATFELIFPPQAVKHAASTTA